MGFNSRDDRKVKVDEKKLGNNNIVVKDDNNPDLNPHIVRGETSSVMENQARVKYFTVRISTDVYEKLIKFQKTEAKKFETQQYIIERALETYMKERNFV